MAKPAPLLLAALSSLAALPLLIEPADSAVQGPGHPRAFELQHTLCHRLGDLAASHNGLRCALLEIREGRRNHLQRLARFRGPHTLAIRPQLLNC